MKKFFSVLSVVAAVTVAVLFSIYGGESGGYACAMMLPIMPSIMGRRLLNRDIQLNTGTFGAGGEELEYPIYDRMKMLNSQAVNTRTLFKTAVGAQREGVTLTWADTNIVQSEQVPSSQKWTLYKLQLEYMAMEPRADLELQMILDYFRTTSFSLQINSKDAMFVLPLWYFLGSTQIVTAPAATINSKLPQAIFSGIWDFSNVPIVLQANTNWGLMVEPQVASNAGLDADYVGFVFASTRARAD